MRMVLCVKIENITKNENIHSSPVFRSVHCCISINDEYCRCYLCKVLVQKITVYYPRTTFSLLTPTLGLISIKLIFFSIYTFPIHLELFSFMISLVDIIVSILITYFAFFRFHSTMIAAVRRITV